MAEDSSKSSPKQAAKGRWGCLRIFFAGVLIILVAFAMLLFQVRQQTRTNGLIQQARAIGLYLFEYAGDHDGKYPEGKTSTEVFQKLIDGGYVSNPANQEEASNQEIFYFPMPGKVKPTSKILKPENVCWDVTCCLDSRSPDQIPVVYMTGYKVTYNAGASAVPETWPARTWWEWLTAVDYPRDFIVANYRANNSAVLRAASDGSIPNFVPADFYAGDTTYHQLTPDGTLP